MGETFKVGCIRPETKVKNIQGKNIDVDIDLKEDKKSMVKVGREVPNFELSGYHKGEFKQFSLDEFKGKWIILCFYPGDFTFV